MVSKIVLGTHQSRRRCCERLLLRGEPLEARDGTIAKPKHLGLIHLEPDVTAPSLSNEPRLDHDRVTEIRDRQRLPPYLCPHLLQHAKEPLRLLTAMVDGGVGEIGSPMQLEVRSETVPEIGRHRVRVDEFLSGSADRV